MWSWELNPVFLYCLPGIHGWVVEWEFSRTCVSSNYTKFVILLPPSARNWEGQLSCSLVVTIYQWYKTAINWPVIKKKSYPCRGNSINWFFWTLPSGWEGITTLSCKTGIQNELYFQIITLTCLSISSE